MKPAERLKAMENAVAVASADFLVPTALKVGLAAMVEEIKEQRARLDTLERGGVDPRVLSIDHNPEGG